MPLWLRWVGIILGAVIVIVLLSAGALAVSGNARLDRSYSVPVETVAIPTDAASLARGQHIVTTVCVACHTPNLGGAPVINAPGFMVVTASNLTSGQGGVAADQYKTDADWVRAIRHGVDPDGKSLLLMPAQDFWYLSDADLGAVIAYVKSVPPVDNTPPDTALALPARLLAGAGRLDALIVARQIDQTGPRPAAPAPGVTADYGHYLVQMHFCQNCHGADLAGGPNPNPTGPAVPNLTPAGELRAWSQADFIKAIRTGDTLSGQHLSDAMPWKTFSGMTDDELQAIWLYLKSLPAKPTT